MKLLNKTTVYYLLFALPVFAICSLSIYYFISREIKDELDENLWKEKISLEKKINAGIDPTLLTEDNVLITEYSGNPIADLSYSDTTLFNAVDQETLPYRVLTAALHNQGKKYRLVIRESYVESDDLVTSIILPIICLFVALLTGFLFINYWISRKLWAPFYGTIGKLREFELGKNDQSFEPQKIKEFDELNRSLNLMTQKAYADFIRQKEFTENASHEIQTPLAVILNKIELLIQSKLLGDEEMKLISGIYDSALKLSHLNKTLLLLTKIENQQFEESRPVNLKDVINKSYSLYAEHASQKNISISTTLKDNVILPIHPVLCETLFNNLFMNAIRHNIENGSIHLDLREKQFSISNTGKPLNMSSESLFERFRKDTSSHESTGLGLAIVKSICTSYSIDITHTYSDKQHLFTLTWK